MASIRFQLGVIVLVFLMLDKVICYYGVWNSKYSDAGISYTSDDVSIWSRSYHYYYTFASSTRCSGCKCDENNQTVHCTGTAVSLESKTFHSVKTGTFSNNTKSIIIRRCPSFTLIENGTFNFLTELTRLDIWRTSITVVPDLSATKVEIVILVDNQIKLTTDNYRGWTFPETIQHISLAGNLIHWIPPGWISGPNLRTVTFANNRLFSIFPNIFGAELSSLIYIGFEFNFIKQISRKGLEGLSTATNFKHLNLSNNNINYIEREAFKQLKELRILELHNNSISAIQQNVFWDLENLIHLDLNKNSMAAVKPKTFMRMPNLRELRLHSQKTPMTSISFLAWRNISNSLRYLYVSDNALITVPHQVLNEEEYPEIIELHVDHNLIRNVSIYGQEAFSESRHADYTARLLSFVPFRTMQNLLFLYLHNNRLTEVVGPEYCSLKSLISLDISYNLFNDDSINDTAFHCIPTLKQLEMAGNSIQHIPVAVNPRDLPNLQTFSMDFNSIAILGEGVFATFQKLSNLYFRNNKIVTVENGSLPSSLQNLAMSSNDFRFLHTGPFWNLYNLVSLDLSSNSIGVIPDHAFFNCTSLESIDLSDNQIPSIKRIHFADCPLTSQIDLQNNIIGTIEDSTFDHVTARPYVYLRGNVMSYLPKYTFNGTSMYRVYLSSNRIEILQSGVFQDLEAYILDLQHNRITVVESGAFLRVSFTYLYLSNNEIHTIESSAFNVLRCQTFYMSNNDIEHIGSFAFSNVTVTYQFDLENTRTSELPSHAFYNVSVSNIDLSNGLFRHLDKHAFSNFRCTISFSMDSNRIESITQPIFDEQSYLTGSFFMHNNHIRYMADNALGWNHNLEYLHLASNEMFVYPLALASLQAQKIFLDNNNIEEIPPGVFSNSSKLRELSLTGNNIEHLPQFPADLVKIESIDLSNNDIETISQRTFTNIKTTLKDVNVSETTSHNSSIEEAFMITSTSALFTVANSLNREAIDRYSLVVEVFDPGLNMTGHITIKVLVNDSNDNCPMTNSTGGSLYAVPALQTDPLAMIYVTDMDLDENSQLSFYISELQFEPSRDYNQSLDLQEHVLTNSSSVTFDVLILDQGAPPRGTIITYNMTLSNTCIIDDRYGYVKQQFIVGSGTSNLYPLYLRIPKYYNYEFGCSDRVGTEYGYVMDNQFSASSVFNEYTGPERARLNLQKNLITNHVGGWVGDVQDQAPWLQVDMLRPYKFTALLLQGREDLPNWVTSYRIYYSDDVSDNFTLYTDGNGQNTFLGNLDQSTVVTKDLDPPILAQFIRIYPQTWKNMNSTSRGNISLRLDFNGCTQAEQLYYDAACLRCETSYYCEGDGKRHSCGRCENENSSNNTDTCNRHPTEHSFGLADSCTSCPDGWICHNGTAYACEKFHYSTCNNSWCPETCTPCEPGYACHSGIRSICTPGTYSNGTVELCQGCKAGTYQPLSGQDSCIPCLPGYHSNQRHDRCDKCEETTYSDGTGNNCIACNSNVDCPCMGHNVCFNGTNCTNTGNGGYTCGDCPTGYQGDGTICMDINECTFYQPYVPCWNGSACINTVPGYQCLECPEGYTSTYEDAFAYSHTQRVFLYMNLERAPLTYQTCVDFNECSINNGGCNPYTKCYNTIGSYYCGICAEGYIGNQTYGCYEADFCASGLHTCSINATCVYFGPGIFKCECKVGYAGNGHICGMDTDNDGHPDNHLSCTEWGCLKDNCVTVPNSVQEDADHDTKGDACDTDDDFDSITDDLDNCQYVSNFDQQDLDNDGVGNVCDNCNSTVNPDQIDRDNDGFGDVCDDDDDNDGIADISDNCPCVTNAGQEDSDSDTVGDVCDNCRDDWNPNQADSDMNGYGDVCDPIYGVNKDMDGDGVLDISDNCLSHSNADQSDIDNDGQGDICDDDIDGDNVPNEEDNCPYVANPLQQDLDGDWVGDTCQGDSDLDGTPDTNDTCIYNPNINVTSFKQYFVVNLDSSLTGANEPVWQVHGNGAEIVQSEDSPVPSMLIGEQGYSDMKYQGTWYVGNQNTTAYIGFVFGFISNRKFYTVLFKGPSPNYEYDISVPAVKGIQLKVVDSNTGPSRTLSNALWHSVSMTNQATMLWHDPNMTSWQPGIAYRWMLHFRPSTGQIQIQVYQGTSIIVDSGQIYDGTITGGRVGVIQYGRFSPIWSNLKVECLMESNKALHFNGYNNFIELTTFPNLVTVNENQLYKLGKSFTFEIWIKIDPDNSSEVNPLFCMAESYFVCLWIKEGILYGAYGATQIQGSQVLTPGQWHNVIFRYSKEHMTCTLFVNGTQDTGSSNTEDIDFTTLNQSDLVMHIGKSGNAFFRGDIEEIRLYNIAIDDSDILKHISNVGLVTAKHQGYIQLHFTMQNENGSGVVVNTGTFATPVVAHGNLSFVTSNQKLAQFIVANPNN